MNYSIFTFSFFYLFSLLLSSLLSVFQSHNLSLCRWWFGRKQAVEDVDLKNRVWLQNTLNRMNDVFTVVFFIEMVIKMLALGFKTYFTNAWCWLDFVIVAVSFYNFLKSKRFHWIPNAFLCCLFSLWAFFQKEHAFCQWSNSNWYMPCLGSFWFISYLFKMLHFQKKQYGLELVQNHFLKIGKIKGFFPQRHGHLSNCRFLSWYQLHHRHYHWYISMSPYHVYY